MDHGFSDNPTLTVAVALAAGMLAQALARHLRVPGIVLLLVTGVVLGPDGLSIVDPSALGDALFSIVSFAVAVILFEGGLNLNISRIRSQAKPIRRLLTVGALATGAGAACAAYAFMGWEWRLAMLFGALVIVTGPTVINPLVRRIGVEPTTATVLEAEGVFIDAIGAILAVVAMEVVIEPSDAGSSVVNIATRLGSGVLLGLAGGAAISFIFRFRALVPSGLENVMTLALALALFQLANALMPESGIAAVIVAGMVVGNLKPRLWRELHEFKEQLTVMLIGLLFVLLAADVRLDQVFELGSGAALVLLCIVFLIRPLAVLLSTARSDLSWRQRVFIAWIGPRGIIAAAIASVFATELATHDVPGGRELRAMVFLVIAVTVTLAGLTGEPLARLLKVKSFRSSGYLVLGANALCRRLAAELTTRDIECVCLDVNPEACRAAEAEGLRVIHGNALSELTLARARLGTRAGALALTPNDEVNLLFCQHAHADDKELPLWATLDQVDGRISAKMLHEIGTRVLFGRGVSVDRWARMLEDDRALLTYFDVWETAESSREEGEYGNSDRNALLRMFMFRDEGFRLIDENTEYRVGDRVAVLTRRDNAEEVAERLKKEGWVVAS